MLDFFRSVLTFLDQFDPHYVTLGLVLLSVALHVYWLIRMYRTSDERHAAVHAHEKIGEIVVHLKFLTERGPEAVNNALIQIQRDIEFFRGVISQQHKSKGKDEKG